MECPYCKNQLISGKIKLRSGARTRLLFSPDKIKDGFIEKHLPGSLFDTGLKSGEIDLMKLTLSKSDRIDTLDAHYCNHCGKIIIDTK